VTLRSYLFPGAGRPRRRLADRPGLNTLRVRLMLAAVTVAMVPLAMGAGALAVASGGKATAPTLVALLACLLLALVAITVWLSHRVLRMADQLELSRSELRKLYEAARSDALIDALTGLGNHRAFQEEFDRQLQYSKRYGTPFSLVLIDLDNFKRINDSLGHAAGDEVLAQMGRLLNSSVREVDRAFRVGGDEFAMLMPRTTHGEALIVARRLLANAVQPQAGARAGTPGSFSAGISSCPSLATARVQLYAQADAALLSAKRHGRTSVEVFDPGRHGPVEEDRASDLGTAVKTIIETRALRPVYQPIVELKSGRVVGYEGLVRTLPNSPFHGPDGLFSTAEAVGRLVELDLACVDVITQGARAIPEHMLLSINLSPRTLEAPEFTVSGLVEIFERNKIAPKRVVLEVTEREDPEDVEHLRRRTEACREVGIRVAADDVGAGNAGLRLLTQVRFDIVKVDLSLVQGGPVRQPYRDVLQSIAELAARWDAYVIAEGVETQEQLRLLRALGIDAAQGYLLAAPSESVDYDRFDLDELESADYWVRRLQRASKVAPGTPAS
jgi:diguanylate cyclase (GGDEF)-like protein